MVTVAGAINRETDGAVRSITVRATSQDGSFAEQTFAINVVDVDEFDVTTPVDANAGVNSVAENTSIGTTVGITGSAVDSDATTNGVTYSLVDNDGGRFAIDTNTGVVSVAGAIDFETDGGLRNITIRATSQDGSFADQTFAINVTPVNDNLPIFQSTAVMTSEENTTAVGQVVATDADLPGQPLVYSLSGADAALFTLDQDTGVLQFNVAHDFERPTDSDHDGIYELVITADDQAGGVSTQALQVVAVDVNETSTAITLQQSTLFENTNTLGGFVVGDLIISDEDSPETFDISVMGGADGAKFRVQGNQLILDDGSLDYERQSSYEVLLRLVDSGGNIYQQHVQVVVQDVNEVPIARADEFFLYNTYLFEVGGPGVLANDTDPEHQVITATVVSGPVNGTLTLRADGSFSYVPRSGFTGKEVFTYQISDGVLSSGVVTVVINVDQQLTPVPSDSSSGGGSNVGDSGSSTSDSGSGSGNANSGPTVVDSGIIAPQAVVDSDTVTGAQSNEARANEAAVGVDGTTNPLVIATMASIGPVELQQRDGPDIRVESARFRLEVANLESVRFRGESSFGHDMHFSEYAWRGLDALEQSGQHQGWSANLIVGTSVVATSGMTIGVILWTVRAGYLVALVSSGIPSWAGFDPIPVLDQEALQGRFGLPEEDTPSLADIAEGNE